MARAGRSIEEIILMRKLEGVLDDKICASKTLDGRKRTDIQPMNVSGMKRNRGNSKTRACGNHDKEIIESLMEHSRLLQERVQVNARICLSVFLTSIFTVIRIQTYYE